MKKNCIKSILSLRLFAVVLLLSASSSVFGQELIKEALANLTGCDTSIIRVKNNDSVVICNSNYRHSEFVLVSPGYANAPTLILKDIHVNDFELFNNQVFYCGYKTESDGRVAIFGYFDYSVFSATSPEIGYWALDTCKQFKKLTVFGFQDHLDYETHIVLIGTTGGRNDALMDYSICFNYPGIEKVYYSDDETESFDDVEATVGFVIVSSRKQVDGIPVVVFNEFHRPTTVMASIFSGLVYNTLRVSSPATCTPVYLEHKVNNQYAATYRVNGYYRFVMLEMDAGNNNINSVEIFGDDAHTVHPTEIKYNRKSEVYDILARSGSVRDDPDWLPQMQIYHITPAVMNNMAPLGYGTWFWDRDYQIWSIDPQRSSDYFVASGVFSSKPQMFRYKHDEWELCPDSINYRYDTGKLEGYEKQEEILAYMVYHMPYTRFEPISYSIPFIEWCGKRAEQEY